MCRSESSSFPEINRFGMKWLLMPSLLPLGLPTTEWLGELRSLCLLPNVFNSKHAYAVPKSNVRPSKLMFLLSHAMWRTWESKFIYCCYFYNDRGHIDCSNDDNNNEKFYLHIRDHVSNRTSAQIYMLLLPVILTSILAILWEKKNDLHISWKASLEFCRSTTTA